MRMTLLGNIVGWIGSLVVLLFAITGFVVGDPLLASIVLTMGILLLPPAWSLVDQLRNQRTHRGIFFVISALIAGLSIGVAQISREINRGAAEVREQEAREKQSVADVKFQQGKARLLEKAEGYLEAGKASEARFLLAEFDRTRDPELKVLQDRVKLALLRDEAARTVSIQRKDELYVQIIALDPNDVTAAKYIRQLEERKEVQRVAQRQAAEHEANAAKAVARKKEIEGQFSAYDGSHRSLERRVKESMNNPDSFEHVKTTYWDYGQGNIKLRMTFRGTNAYNAMVTQTAFAVATPKGEILELQYE
jgi:hypothetical protein